MLSPIDCLLAKQAIRDCLIFKGGTSKALEAMNGLVWSTQTTRFSQPCTLNEHLFPVFFCQILQGLVVVALTLNKEPVGEVPNSGRASVILQIMAEPANYRITIVHDFVMFLPAKIGQILRVRAVQEENVLS